MGGGARPLRRGGFPWGRVGSVGGTANPHVSDDGTVANMGHPVLRLVEGSVSDWEAKVLEMDSL